MWIDSHCHLDQLDMPIERVLARARQAGVHTVVTICTQPSEWPTVKEYIERFDQVYAAVGLHPMLVDQDYVATYEQMLSWLDHPKVVAIGETGLDYYYSKTFAAEQQKSFRHHLEVSARTGLPVVIHTRAADEDTLALVGKGPVKGILHCFSHNAAMAQGALAAGLHISVSGIATFGKSEEIRAALKDVPLNRLLIETDAPYLAPHPRRGKTNEPSFLPHTAACLAEIKGVDIFTLASMIGDNFYNLFDKITDLNPAAQSA
ncbi:MAG: TatD family hydrolase [Pseudomonadota bacterium]